MANITTGQAVKATRMFIGKAWINTVKKEGDSLGIQFMNISLDNVIVKEDGSKAPLTSITLTPNDKIQLWPNQKRDGKKDADYRLSIVSAEAADGATQKALV